jgi:hypothetical protein
MELVREIIEQHQCSAVVTQGVKYNASGTIPSSASAFWSGSISNGNGPNVGQLDAWIESWAKALANASIQAGRSPEPHMIRCVCRYDKCGMPEAGTLHLKTQDRWSRRCNGENPIPASISHPPEYPLHVREQGQRVRSRLS